MKVDVSPSTLSLQCGRKPAFCVISSSARRGRAERPGVSSGSDHKV